MLDGFEECLLCSLCCLSNVLYACKLCKLVSVFTNAGVAELGGPGGRPWPPQKFEWVGQSMFWPPKILTIAPPLQNSEPVVKIFAKLLLSTMRYANFQKFSPAAG